MQNCTTVRTLVVLLTLWLNSLAAEKNIILRTLTATSNDNNRKTRDVSGPSMLVTPKPSCPSFITCPYPPYPRPTTKQPMTIVEYFRPGSHIMDENSTPISVTENKSEQPIEGNEQENVQGPSISATTKPPCPGFITCPYPPHPRPTTKPPQEESVTKPSTITIPDKLIVDYIGPEKENTPEKSPTVSDTMKVLDSVNKPGNAQGPSISVTTKPPCPGYITCPYPSYPRPTTKPPQEESVTNPSATSTPDKLIVDYIGPDEGNTPEKTPTVSDTNPKPEVLDSVNKPGNAQGPSISVTTKPPCPGYITCPYPPYPRPTTKPPHEESVTKPSATSTPDKLIVDYIGPDEENTPEKTPSVSDTNSKPEVIDSVNRPGNAQGPSISATSKSPCPSYISCPYPSYPRPTTKPPQEESVTKPSTSSTTDKLIVDYIGPDEGNTPEKTPTVSDTNPKPDVSYSVNKPGNVQGPSISATSKPPCPSYITCPYPSYPRPTTKQPSLHDKTISHDKTIVDYIIPDTTVLPEDLQSIGESSQSPTTASEETADASVFFESNGSPMRPSPQDPVVLGNQGAFLPFYSYVYGIDPYAQNAYYYNNRRPILLTPRPFWPSYLKNPWIYPRPVGSEFADDQDSDSSNNQSSEDSSSDVEKEDSKDDDNESAKSV